MKRIKFKHLKQVGFELSKEEAQELHSKINEAAQRGGEVNIIFEGEEDADRDDDEDDFVDDDTDHNKIYADALAVFEPRKSALDELGFEYIEADGEKETENYFYHEASGYKIPASDVVIATDEQLKEIFTEAEKAITDTKPVTVQNETDKVVSPDDELINGRKQYLESQGFTLIDDVYVNESGTEIPVSLVLQQYDNADDFFDIAKGIITEAASSTATGSGNIQQSDDDTSAPATKATTNKPAKTTAAKN